jgi:hypothetical protein
MTRLRVAMALAWALAAAPSCGPDFVYDNPCDPQSTDYDPCLCTRCFASTCQSRTVEGQPSVCGCRDGAAACGATSDAGVGTCCETGQVCLAATGECCTPACAGRECGDDGCGGTCEAEGSAPCGDTCVDGHWIFTACDGKECGDNGCEGSCGTCAAGKACDAAGLCVAGG